MLRTWGTFFIFFFDCSCTVCYNMKIKIVGFFALWRIHGCE